MTIDYRGLRSLTARKLINALLRDGFVLDRGKTISVASSSSSEAAHGRACPALVCGAKRRPARRWPQRWSIG